ncbi:MAG: FG-GAP repeat protein, partial [Pyrinomonadaceae bacterium]|nr:FG-GAP repeat protein [Phycisphaerales bacterium]
MDGDGYNDWVETWYFAKAMRANGTCRLDSGNSVIIPPLTPSSTTYPTCPEDMLCQDPIGEQIGFCRVISGRTGKVDELRTGAIGQDIWGNFDSAKFAHEISPIDDLDGDGRAEIVLTSNAVYGGRGAVFVYAFSSNYNVDPEDGTQRW